jgi:predicted MFS family arabinose efflux permease
MLIGVGMASVLIGSLKVFALRFPAGRFATLMGMIVSIGTLGGILATSPLVYLSGIMGWRTIFVVGGAMTVLLGLLVFWVLGDEEEGLENSVCSVSSELRVGISRSMRLIVGSLSFWQIGVVAFFRYGTFVGLQGL